MTRFSFAARTVLLTGAGRGIGRAILELLVARGAHRIIAVARDHARLEELHSAFPIVEPYAADLAQPDQVVALVDFVKASAPDLSLVIHNAGTQLLTDLVDPECDRHQAALSQEIATNFSSPIALTVALLPILLAQSSAMLVNVTSGLALAPKQSSPVYCATKAGLRSFTKALRYQAQARAAHIRIVEALPPIVDTRMTRGRGRGKITPEACAQEIISGIEAGRETIYVGKAKLLRAIQGVSPSLADRLMRNG